MLMIQNEILHFFLQFFHDRRKLVREYLRKSNDEQMTEDWFERGVDKTFLIEIRWALNFDVDSIIPFTEIP
jgi:hypothetical protein